MWEPEAEAWREFEELVVQTHAAGQSLDHFRKHLRALAERRGWNEVRPFNDRWALGGFSLRIYREYSIIAYARHRLRQLTDAGFGIWVYRLGDPRADCAADHAALDGIALPPDHPFWARLFPPNGPGCGCEARGARTVAGIRRAGGDPDKALPEDWGKTPVHTQWIGTDWPDLRGIVEAALREAED